MFGGCLEVHAGRGRISWREVPETYTMVFPLATLGGRYVDPQLDFNLQGAADRMIIPFHVVTGEPVESQGENFARAIGLRTGIATMLAWEPPFGAADPAPVFAVEEMVRWVKTATGRDPILRYEGWGTDYSKLVRSCPRMVSSSHDAPSQDLKWLFWQQPSLGVVPGVPGGRVDHVWWNGDEDGLEGFFRSGALLADRPGAARADAGDRADAGGV